MKVFLCGGGSGIQTNEALKRLNEVIDHSKPCLYIPLAMKANMYDNCYKWIKDELKDVHIPFIEMVRTADELTTMNLKSFSFIFIGGGNTFKLLNDLKISGSYGKIKKYLDNDGIIFGGSAGAIIFGADLEACQIDDINEVNLKEIDGFDILNGISILCHYTNGTVEKTEKSRQYLLEISKHRKVMALPEEITLFINGSDMEIFGDGLYYFFEDGVITKRGENKDEYQRSYNG